LQNEIEMIVTNWYGYCGM